MTDAGQIAQFPYDANFADIDHHSINTDVFVKIAAHPDGQHYLALTGEGSFALFAEFKKMIALPVAVMKKIYEFRKFDRRFL